MKCINLAQRCHAGIQMGVVDVMIMETKRVTDVEYANIVVENFYTTIGQYPTLYDFLAITPEDIYCWEHIPTNVLNPRFSNLQY